MPEQAMTLSVLAGLDVSAAGPGVSAADREQMLTTLRDRARAIRGLEATDLGARLLDFLAGSLREPLQNLLGAVWKQRKELRDAAAKGEDGRDVHAEVELVSHDVEWTVNPSVKLEVDGVNLHELEFEAKLRLSLEGVVLVLENAHITEVKSGSVSSTIELTCEGFPLGAPYEKKVELRGAFVLPKGGIDLSP